MVKPFHLIFFLLAFSPNTSNAQLFFIDASDTSDYVFYPKRIAELDRLIQLDSNRYEYYFKRANMYYKFKKYPECIADYRLINKKFGDDETAYNNMALAYGFLKDSTNAFPCYERSLQLNPDDPMNWLNSGYVLLQFDLFERALPYFEKAIELKSNYAKAYYFIGYLSMKLGDYEKAKFHYAEAIKLNILYPEATFNLGFIAYEEKKYAEAIPYFDKIIDYGFRLEKTVISEAYLFRSKCFTELGDKTKAAADQEKATQLMVR